MPPAKTETEWEGRASRYLKAELKRRDITYDELADRLRRFGYKDETKASIANKLVRGTFPAPFFIASLVAIGCENVRLDDI